MSRKHDEDAATRKTAPAAGRTPGPAAKRALPPWLAPVALLVVVGAVVAWFVFRDSDEERGTKLMAQAREAMQVQDYPTAEARLLQAAKLAPQNGVLQHNLGILYLKQQRLPEARAAFERAAAAHGPEAGEVRAEEFFQLAGISYLEKKWQLANTELESAIAAQPTRSQLHARLVDLELGRLNAPAAADSSTARWLRLCGRTPRNLGDAAYIHFQHKSYPQALALAGQSVALQDSFVEGHAMVARSLSKEGRHAEALKALERPLAAYPKAPELWVAKAMVLLDSGLRTPALAAADQAVSLAPRNFEAHQSRQMALAAHGRLKEALQEIEVARELTADPADQRMLLTQQRLLRSMMAQEGAAGIAADSTATAP